MENTYTGQRGLDDHIPTQEGAGKNIAVVGMVVAILAAIMALAGLYMANSADGHAGDVDGKVGLLDKAYKAYVKENDKNIKMVNIDRSADATRLTLLEGKVGDLESKSVVAALAKELRDGKASKYSVDVLRNEVLDKADAKTVKRLAKRMGRFDTRINNIVELNKLVEVAPQPAPTPAPTPAPVPAPTPQSLPPAPAK